MCVCVCVCVCVCACACVCESHRLYVSSQMLFFSEGALCIQFLVAPGKSCVHAIVETDKELTEPWEAKSPIIMQCLF